MSRAAVARTRYLRNLQYHGVVPIPGIFELVAEVLVRRKRFQHLYQLLQYHIPQDSPGLVKILIAAARHHPPLLQHALDMLHRLNEYVGISSGCARPV